VDGDCISPSASAARDAWGTSEENGSAPQSGVSQLTPSAGLSQATGSTAPGSSHVTQSYNNRTAQNSYTYRVAPRHGQSPTYSRESVQPYSSSNPQARTSFFGPEAPPMLEAGGPHGSPLCLFWDYILQMHIYSYSFVASLLFGFLPFFLPFSL
jgi:hypothetical protein